MMIAVCLFLILGGSAFAAHEVTTWNEIAGSASLAPGLTANPLFESRIYAITQTAVHNALNAIDRRSDPMLSTTVGVGRLARSGGGYSRASRSG